MKIVLVLAYLSMYGEPRIEIHTRADYAACRKEAAAWFKQVKAGSGRAWCEKVIDGRKEG